VKLRTVLFGTSTEEPMALPTEFSETLASLIEASASSVVRVEGGRRRPVSGVVIAPHQVVTVAYGLEHQELIVGVEGAAIKARVRGRDESTDLALLEVEGTLTPAPLIPTGTIRRVVAQLELHGRVRRSHLGLKLQPVELPPALHELTQEELGLLVLEVEPGGPADVAGVGFGDTLLHLGDDSVRTLHDLYGYLREDRGGQTVPVRLLRQRQVATVQVTLGAK